MGAWKGLYATTRLYTSITSECQDLDPHNKSAMAICRVLDDIRLCLTPNQIVHKCTGAVDKVPHGLGAELSHIAIGSLDVKIADGGHGGVTIIKWDDTNIEVQGVAGNEVRLLAYRLSKFA